MIERYVNTSVFPPALLAVGTSILGTLGQVQWLSVWGLSISTCWLAIGVYDRYKKYKGAK